MIYLNQWTGEMFHSQEECEKSINKGIRSCLTTEEILEREAIRSKFQDLVLALFDRDEQEVGILITSLSIYLDELRSSEMNYAYEEVDDDKLQYLLDEGYVWGDSEPAI